MHAVLLPFRQMRKIGGCSFDAHRLRLMYVKSLSKNLARHHPSQRPSDNTYIHQHSASDATRCAAAALLFSLLDWQHPTRRRHHADSILSLKERALGSVFIFPSAPKVVPGSI